MKVGIIGAGFVGSTTAYTLAIKGLVRDIVLVDINTDKANAEAMDVIHAAALNSDSNVYCGDYEDLDGAQIVIITVDSQKALTDSRLDLLESNTKIMREIVPKIIRNAPNCIILAATNPVDVITKVILDISKFPSNRVIGSGTVLDTARFRAMLSDYFNVSPHSIHAYVMGEHGSSSLVSWSTASIGGSSLDNYGTDTGRPLVNEAKAKMTQDVIDAGFKIYHGKRATYYGIASSLVKICEAIIKDEKRTLTVSSLHKNVEGFHDVCLSLPTIVSRRGAYGSVVPDLNDEERKELRRSAEVMDKANREAEKILKGKA